MAVTDLINTKWLFNNVLDVSGGLNYTINFISNNINFTSLSCFPDIHLSFLMYDDVTVGQGLGEFDTGGPNINTWDNEAYKTIEITGGTDVTNSNLISWLTANATQQSEPNPLVETTISVGTKKLYNAYLGQGALQKIYKGTSLIFNRLEANFETSDHNLLITSNGDVFNVQDAPTTSYSVAITESNTSQSNLNYKSYLRVYDGQDATGTLLINSTGNTAMPSTSVTCTTGYLYLEDCSTLGGGYTQIYSQNIVGNISQVGYPGQTPSGNAYTIMKIDGDGSFAVGTDYNYD